MIATMSEEDKESSLVQVFEMFLLSPCYSDIVYVLQHLSPPPGMARNKSRTLKLKAAKFCIMNNSLYWKDPSGVLLNCVWLKKRQNSYGRLSQGRLRRPSFLEDNSQ